MIQSKSSVNGRGDGDNDREGERKKEEKLESAVVMEIRVNWKFKKKT